MRAESRTARTRSTSTATRKPSPDAWPGRRPRSRPCWIRAGRCTRSARSAWSTRPGPAACSPRKDNAPDRPWTGRRRPSPSPTPSPTSRTVTPHPTEQNQNTEQTTLAPGRLQRETGTGKTAVVLDNARPHHARALTDLHEPGRLLERITPVFLPPYAPDHNPAEHVRNTAKNNTATIQHETPEETLGASASHVTDRTVDYDSEHLPPRETRNDPAP
ncbi:transposase [Propionibacterium acidifaciens]